MFRALVSIALVSLSVTACARENAAPPAAAPAPAQTGAKPAVAPESRAAAAAQETRDASPEDRGDAALERLAAMPAAQQLPANDVLKPGVNYKPVVPAQPTDVPAGKVEVMEFFWFGCPHCNAIEPIVESWLRNKPEYVEFVRVHVTWQAPHKAHARLLYTLQALGREDLVPKVFDTIHRENNMLAARDDDTTRKLQSDFARANGIDPKKFLDAWNSFGVNSKLQHAEDLTTRYQVQSVPEFVVNGKYQTDVGMAGGPSQLIAVIDALAASEKRR